MNTNFKVALAFIGGTAVGSYMCNQVYKYIFKAIINAGRKGADEKVQDTHNKQYLKRVK